MKKKNRKLVEIMEKKEVDPISMTRLFHLTACSNYTGEVMTSFSSVPSITFCSAHLRYISGFHKLSMHTAYTPRHLTCIRASRKYKLRGRAQRDIFIFRT